MVKRKSLKAVAAFTHIHTGWLYTIRVFRRDEHQPIMRQSGRKEEFI